ncbi:BgTH12-00750 [Blumeria graminis f. sp. triticale]|uniref:BgTH12-00750 n=1 Tax=Blumeria graminis f. sp. triticale TaxID=1689686 RepID=A0A9W4D6V7_BLUGR|nr:BgTH12-00750 [Blumeria graminis f. sp. triticale]
MIIRVELPGTSAISLTPAGKLTKVPDPWTWILLYVSLNPKISQRHFV